MTVVVTVLRDIFESEIKANNHQRGESEVSSTWHTLLGWILAFVFSLILFTSFVTLRHFISISMSNGVRI